MHTLLALLLLLTHFFNTALAKPHPQQGISTENTGGFTTTNTTATNNTTALGEGFIDCAPSNTQAIAWTWECVNLLQAMPKGMERVAFQRNRELPRDFHMGKCYAVVSFAGNYDNVDSSWYEIQNAGSQLLTACSRSGGGPSILSRSGGMIKLGPDHKLEILMSKPPRPHDDGEGNGATLTEGEIAQMRASVMGGIKESQDASQTSLTLGPAGRVAED